MPIDAMNLHLYARTDFVTFNMLGNEKRVKRIHKQFQSSMFLLSGHVDNMALYKMLFI